MKNNLNVRSYLQRVITVSRNTLNRLRLAGNQQKVFCIGLNKTGTTSIKKAWQDLGLIVGNQAEARKLLQPWIQRDFAPIIKYCKSAQAFQDSPFSFPYTYVALDQAFPGSKFILTVRNDAEQWYNSITKFHGDKWANGHIPTKEDLMNAVNDVKGRPWIVNRALFDTPDNEPYRKADLLEFYNRHIDDVTRYFKHRPTDLLIINLSEREAYQKFVDFLDVKSPYDSFPWENKT